MASKLSIQMISWSAISIWLREYSAVRKVRARLKNPPYSVEDYLATLTRQGLVVTASELEQFAQLI